MRRDLVQVEVVGGHPDPAQPEDLGHQGVPDVAPGVFPSRSARTWRATSGAGTSSRRTILGSDRISSVTSSSRRPGTCQENSSGLAWLSVFSGMSMVTPSASLPGSNAYDTVRPEASAGLQADSDVHTSG